MLGEDGQPKVNTQDGLPAWSRDAGAFEQYTNLANRDGAGLPGQAFIRSPAPSTAGSCASVPRTPAGPPFAIVPFHGASSASMVSGGTRSSPGAGSNGGVMQPAPAPKGFFWCCKCHLNKPIDRMMLRGNQKICDTDVAEYSSLVNRWKTQRNLHTWWSNLTPDAQAAWYRKQQESSGGIGNVTILKTRPNKTKQDSNKTSRH